ncbi:ABC transporter permease [Geomicrobium sp. JCM 19055]|uniref:ABC transporter permease n=1 Tax=Geomicrobium sp. JCM 19055 TaxID=1460649 RepID=UPI00045ED6E0|nr:ABC transporter permease [Geomicrobium sp. JCM 19055]GAK00189.1 multidrug ABC transporter permease [Geomicrobium sp. JCM 19055]
MSHEMDHTRMQRAISGVKRPEDPSMLQATLAFSSRALIKIKHVPEQMFDVTVFPIIFLMMFTYLFGGALSGSATEYLQYLLPGILVMTVIQITMYTGTELNNDIRKGIFDRFRTLPIWLPSTLIGSLLVDVIRYSIAMTIMITLGVILGFRPDGGVVGVLLAVVTILLFAFCFSWIWTTLGIVMRSDKSIMMASMMVIFPLTFISNVFVDPETLPGWLQGFVAINPISLLTTAVRGLMHGTATIQDLTLVLIVAVILFIIFAPLTMFLFRNSEKKIG